MKQQGNRARGILLVCDANVCRSALAEFVIAEALSAQRGFLRVPVESRGVDVPQPLPVCELVAHVREDEKWAARAQRHRSRRLDAAAIERARLVLTANRASRAAVASLVPDARRRVFTLREAVALGEGYAPQGNVTGVAAVDELASYLDTQRGRHTLPTERTRFWRKDVHPYDIRDGHLHGRKQHEKTVQLVRAESTRLAALLLVAAPEDNGSTERSQSA